jgi:hypothetical protein
MSYDRRHILAQWGGTLPGGEIWSNSLRLCSTETGPSAGVPDHDFMHDWLYGSAKDAIANYHSDSATHIASGAKLTFAKMNVVDMQGRYIEQATHEYIYAPPVAGAGGAFIHPNQVTLAVSLTTEFVRGHAHRGRYYLPTPSVQVDGTTGLVPVTTCQDIAATSAAFIEALADEPGPDLILGQRVAVMSSRGTGATNVVIGVEVGRVMDTQRRRRNAMGEDYQTHVVDQGGG